MSSRPYLFGGLFLLLGGWIGWMLAQRTADSHALAGTQRALTGFKPNLSKIRSAPVPQTTRAAPAGLTSVRVDAGGAKVLEQTSGGARRIRAATTQPVRISPSSSVRDNPDSGMPVAPGEQPIDLGILPPGQELFAVIPAGGVPAMVTLWMQEV